MKARFESFSEEVKGELFLGSGVLIWAFFPIMIVLMASGLPALFSAGVSTIVACIFMGIVSGFKTGFSFLRKNIWLEAFLLALFIGVGQYGLMFFAAHYTSPGNIAVLSLSQIFFGFLILHFLKLESYKLSAYIGSFFLLMGSFIIIYKPGFIFNLGDILVLLAQFLAPIGNLYQRRLRTKITAVQIIFVRSLIAGLILLGLSFCLEEIDMSFVSSIDWFYMFLMGIIFLGLQKLLWVEAIHRISITKASSLAAVEPIITIGLVYLIFQTIPTSQQWIGIVPTLIGAYLIIGNRGSFQIKKT